MYPPGPRGYPILGVLPQLRSDPIATFLDAADRYGDMVHLKAGPHHGFLLSDPADIKHVLQDNARNYHKSPLYERLRDSLGNGLLTSEDSFWLRQRRLAQPAFHRQRLTTMADAMVSCTEQRLERWEHVVSSGETIDLVAEMMALTQAIIVRTMFSTDLGATAEVVNRTWPIINRRIGETFWSTNAYIPFGGGPRGCIGNQFAMLEAQLIVAMIGQRFRIELVPDQNIRPEPLITLRPTPGIRATIRKRERPTIN